MIGSVRTWARRVGTGRSLSWRTAGLAGLVGILVLSALTVEGFRSARFDLDEAGVWATNAKVSVAGRVNTQISQLDALSPRVSPAVDVIQDGRMVALVDRDKSLKVLDVASAQTGAAVKLPAKSEVVLGGGRVGVLDKSSGKVWARTFGSLGSLDVGTTEATASLGKGALIAAGFDGSVYGVSVVDDEIRLVAGSAGGAPSVRALLVQGDDLQAAVVGSTPVVLSPGEGEIQVGDQVVDLTSYGKAMQLQEGPADGDSVAVATESQLLVVGLGDGKVSARFEGGVGRAVRPVSVGGCAYGAWSGADDGAEPLMAAACSSGKPVSGRVAVAVGSEMRFRVNGEHVLLNSLADGKGFIIEDGEVILVDNWDELLPKSEQVNEDEEDDSEDGANGDIKCDVEAKNRPPTAAPDPDLGARSATSTLLQVLANDRDPDCDVLAIARLGAPSPASAVEALEPVDRGRSVQFRSVPGFTGVVTFSYFVSDGRSEAVEGTATVTVRPLDGANGKPKQNRGGSRVTVAKGQQVTYNVLNDFEDPDGDPLVLLNAALAAGSSGTVRSQTDGEVVFVDDGTTVGQKQLDLQVSDGQDTVGGVLAIEVVDSAKPIARNDHAIGLVGQPVTIEVLENDADAGGDVLRLAGVDQKPANVSVTPDTTAGLVVFRSDKAGSFRFRYTIGSGGETAQAFVRVDISDPGENEPPVAVRDLAIVSVGGSELVDVVVNDADPNGDVLVVQSVTVPAGTGVSAQLLEKRAIRVSASRPSATPVTVTYSVSDGQAPPVEGQLIVQIVAAGELNRAPLARDDLAVVRAGDVVTVPVLANDSDPDGDVLTLSPKVVQNVTPGDPEPGVAFVDGSDLRFVAGASPGAVSISYSVSDEVGQSQGALVRVTILAADARNQAPIPRNLEARAFAGTTIKIGVPTSGIDPDGDQVSLRLQRPPTKGRIVKGEETALCGCFFYEAFPDARGTDVFTYLATDPGGQSAWATVRVGVAERLAINQLPVVVDDLVRVRPGGRVLAPLLDNDTDPDGDLIDYAPGLTFAPSGGVNAKVRGDRVLITAKKKGTVTLPYSVVDAFDGVGSGYVTVQVSDTAPLIAPVARDDIAVPTSARATTVDVAVLDNDRNDGGTMAELEVEVDKSVSSGAEVRGQKVRITLNDRPRLVLYSITDRNGAGADDDRKAFAVIRVPGAKVNQPPRARGRGEFEVDAGESIAIKVADVAVDPEGSRVLLTQADRLTATKGTVVPTGPDAFTFTAPTDYAGQASITLEVTDGADPADPAGARATISLSVTVIGTTNSPPTFSGASVPVALGDGPATLDLSKYVSDVDPGDLAKITFDDLSGDGRGLTASISGSTLEVSADKPLAKGETRQLSLTVSDGTNEPVPGAVAVSVVGSTKPLAKANDDSYDDARSGEPSTFAVLENDLAPEGLDPIEIVDVVGSPSLGAASHDGRTVTFTPSAEFVGTADLTYTINDSLQDPDREVTASIRVTVKDRPAQPSAPTVGEFGNRFVVLTWQAPRDNGSPITGYEVASTDGTIRTTKCGVATTCKLDQADGLVNGTKYNFTILATNEVGDSDPSAPSGDVVPDVRPNALTAAPGLTWSQGLGSGELEMSWPAAGSSAWINEGTQVTDYEIEVSPAPLGGQPGRVPFGSTGQRLTGLTNGVDYTVRIRAKNSAVVGDGWSDWSPSSTPESPATIPDTPAAPTAVRVDNPIGEQIEVNWSAPEPNAKAMTGYKIIVYRNGTASTLASTQPVANSSFTQVVSAVNGDDYKFAIVATNKAGDSDESAQSNQVRSFGKPSAVAGVSVSAPGVDGTLNLSYAWPADNGDPIDGFEVTVSSPDGGAGTGIRFIPARRSRSALPPPPPSAVISGLTNGKTYNFMVRACNQGSNTAYCGDPSPASPNEVPYGPPGDPTVSAAPIGTYATRLSWSAAPNNGRPTQIQIQVNGGGWEDVGPSGSRDFDECNKNHSIKARAVSAGLTSGEQAASRPTPACPNPRVSKYQGGPNPTRVGSGADTCNPNRCSMVGFQMFDFVPNSTHTVNCTFGPPNGVGSVQVTVDGAGNASGLTRCVAGNTTVGILVDGTAWDTSAVLWAR